MMSDPEPRRPWFRLVARTKRHTYYRAVSNVPGMLLFALIVVLGAAALVAAVRDYRHLHMLVREDRILGGIGLFLIVLGIWQGVKLARR
ncbi:MAG: hypothetical protein KGN34_17890 [Sphingomonadales bacterium]|nr:hypothetical protein [Sphingomonadales bacterium]